MNKKVLISGASIVALVVLGLLAYRILTATAPGPVIISETRKDEGSLLLSKAQGLVAGGNLLKAKEAYQRIIEKSSNSETIQKAQGAIDGINMKILFSPIITPDSFMYEVEKGDNLTRVAKKFNTTVELISKANGVSPNAIKVGKKLKISKARFSIVVDRSQNILTLKSDADILKTYKVSTGKNNSTPAGTFKITSKIVDPPWYPPAGGVIQPGDPRNVLGSRWLGISKQGYGIHGTTDPQSLGKSVTEGCVRMANTDVEELYSIVPEGTEVVIVD